jgi:hypothetical protein
MRQLSRAFRRRDPIRVAGTGFAISTALVLAAYIVNVIATQAKVGGVAAAVVLLAIACTGLLYAWRPGAGGLVE